MYFRAGSSPAGRKRIREGPFFLFAEENQRRFTLPFYKKLFRNVKMFTAHYDPFAVEIPRTRRSKPGPLHSNEKGRQDRMSESRTLPSQR